MTARARSALVLLSCLALTACGSTVQYVGSATPQPGADGLTVTAPLSPEGTVSVPDQVGAPGVVVGGESQGSAPGRSSGPAAPVSAGPSTAARPTGTASTAIPTTGPGWDAKNVYVGVPTADDFNTVARGLGGNFSNGDVHGDIDALVEDINRSGGLLGRKLVVAYHDTSTTALSSNPASVAQSMCSYFTQDRPVIAVVNGAPQLDAQDGFHTCLEKKQTTLLSLSNSDYSDKDYVRLGPHLFTVGSLSVDVLVPTFVRALDRQKYFTGWDTTTGGPGSAAVRVGLLLPDSPAGRHVGSVFRVSLKAIGVQVASDFYYDPVGTGGKAQSEVLQFASAKVTHVLDLPPIAAELYFFQGSAEQQRYRPRYGFTSFNLPLSTEENASIAPAAQQVGSIGIGWQPYNDVNAQHDVGAQPVTKRCFAALAKGGQSFTSSSRRAALVATQLCDSFYLLRDAVVAGGGYAGGDLLRGMPLAGPKLLTAGTYASSLSSDNPGVPGSYVDAHYEEACSCFVSQGSKRRFAR